jgi:hypothetical protein
LIREILKKVMKNIILPVLFCLDSLFCVGGIKDTAIFPFGENPGYYGNQFIDQQIYDLMYAAGARAARPVLNLQQYLQFGIATFAERFNYPFQNKGMRNNVFTFWIDPYGGPYEGQSTFKTAGGKRSLLPASLDTAVFNSDSTVNRHNLWASYVADIYTAVGGSFQIFEGYNEPDLNNNYVDAQYDSAMGYYHTWATNQPSPDQTINTNDSLKNVVRMYQITWQVIHHLSHNKAKVGTGGISLRYWWRQALKLGIGQWIDIITIHTYPYYYWAYWTSRAPVGSGNHRNSDMLLRINDSLWSGIQNISRQNGISANLAHALTETNVPGWNYDNYTVAANPGSINKRIGNDHVQRNYILKGVADLWRKGFCPIIWYQTGDNEDSGTTRSGTEFSSEGLYMNLNATATAANAKIKQAGVAIQTMQRICGNYTMDPEQPIFPDGVDGIRLDSNGHKILMLWTKTNVDSSEVPKKLLGYNLGPFSYKKYNWDGSSSGMATGIVILSGDPVFYIPQSQNGFIKPNGNKNAVTKNIPDANEQN